jgi:hypothetical protein
VTMIGEWHQFSPQPTKTGACVSECAVVHSHRNSFGIAIGGDRYGATDTVVGQGQVSKGGPNYTDVYVCESLVSQQSDAPTIRG